MTGVLRRGLVAGAAGTTALHAATYLDMAVRGRPASTTPEESVRATEAMLGQRVPGDRKIRESRITALGALGGIGTGLAVGVAASIARTAGVRLPAPVGAVATGAAAMTAGNASAVTLGVTDPRTWSSADWASDALPHLAYGIAASTALRQMDKAPQRDAPARSRPSSGLVLRAAALGVASGARSSLGVAGLLLTAPRRPGRAGSMTGRAVSAAGAIALGAELAADKHPATPSRLETGSLALRLASGSGGGLALARRAGMTATLPALAGAVGAAAGSLAGAAWREASDGHLPAWQAALVEDGVALLLAGCACLPGRGLPAGVPSQV